MTLPSQSPATWRNKPITEKQKDLMDQMSIRWDESMTRGEASDAITQDLEESPHIFSEDAFHE